MVPASEGTSEGKKRAAHYVITYNLKQVRYVVLLRMALFARTCWRRVDLHHDPVHLRCRELELVQELVAVRVLLRVLQLAHGVRHRLDELALREHGMGQDEADVERPQRGGRVVRRAAAPALKRPPARLIRHLFLNLIRLLNVPLA